jgi:hypothetical protein
MKPSNYSKLEGPKKLSYERINEIQNKPSLKQKITQKVNNKHTDTGNKINFKTY